MCAGRLKRSAILTTPYSAKYCDNNAIFLSLVVGINTFLIAAARFRSSRNAGTNLIGAEGYSGFSTILPPLHFNGAGKSNGQSNLCVRRRQA